MKILSSVLMTLVAVSVFNVPSGTIVYADQTSLSDSAIQTALVELNQYTDIQKHLNIQNADLAYAMRKALVMADLLLDAEGKLNLKFMSSCKIPAFISAPLRRIMR